MKLFKIFFFLFIVQVYFGMNCFGQTDCMNIKTLESQTLYHVKPFPQVRSNDVLWQRRLWREIDLSEKVNQHLYFSKENEKKNCSLYDILFYYIEKGLITAYDTKDDAFTKELTIAEIINTIGDSLIDNQSKNLNFVSLNSRDVIKYWLKEDWFYNSVYSKIEVRIIGICPVKVKKDDKGDVMGYQQLFWLYFPNIRNVLVKFDAIEKEKEEDERISFDDVFFKRMFNSYIIQKEGNQNLEVKENLTELDIRLENEITKVYFFNKKTQLWGN